MSEGCARKPDYPFSRLTEIAQKATGPCPAPPTDDECFALWDKYEMLANVRQHSLTVASIATALANRAYELGHDTDVAAVRAAALLHDLAKTWCIRNGGSHALLGGAWVAQETGNYKIAQGVILHVHWPWPLPQDILCLPILVLYADKRVRHEQCVTLEERFADLQIRYGRTEAARKSIAISHEQSRAIEHSLSKQLKWSLDENSFDCGRLVN